MRTLWILLGCFLVFGQAHAGWVPVATVNEKTPGHLCDVDDHGLDLFCGGNNPQLMANGGISSTSISTTVINFEGVTATSVLGAGGNFIVSGTTSVSASNAGTIKFATAGSERMVIDGTGNVGIGTNSPNALLEVNGGAVRASRGGAAIDQYLEIINNDASGGFIRGLSREANKKPLYIENVHNGSGSPAGKLPILFRSGPASSPIEHMRIAENGNVGIGDITPDYKLDVDGTAYATGAAGALSDRRHKKAIEDLPVKGLETIRKLRPVQFQWKDPQDAGMEGAQFGFIAQEVEEVLPQVILTQDDEEQTKGMKPTALIPVLTKAIQEQNAEIIALKDQLNAQKAQNAAFRQELDSLKQMLEAR